MVETAAGAAATEPVVLLLVVDVVAAAVEVVLGVTELDAQLTVVVVVDILSSAIVAEFRRKNPSTSTRVEMCHNRSHVKTTVTRHRFLAKTTFDVVVTVRVVIFQTNPKKKAREARYRIALWIGDRTLGTVLLCFVE